MTGGELASSTIIISKSSFFGVASKIDSTVRRTKLSLAQGNTMEIVFIDVVPSTGETLSLSGASRLLIKMQQVIKMVTA